MFHTICVIIKSLSNKAGDMRAKIKKTKRDPYHLSRIYVSIHFVDQSAQKETYLGYRYNNERASAGTFCDDTHELGVDGTEVVVVDVLGDGHAIEAVLSISYFSINVAKLGASVGWTP